MSRYTEFVERVEARLAEHPEWREGQACFNVLYYDGFDPVLADEIRGGPLDPFHRDDIVPAFLTAVSERWAEAA